MSQPVQVGELLPGVVAEVIARAGPGYDRWAERSRPPATAPTRFGCAARSIRSILRPRSAALCMRLTGNPTPPS